MPPSRPPGSRGFAGAAVLACATLLTGCGVLPGSDPPSPVVIAADLPLTGAGAAHGQVLRQALELRVEQVNARGLLGERRLVLVVRDNRSAQPDSTDQLAEFAEDPEVTAIVTGGCGDCVAQAAPMLDAAGVPTIALVPGATVAAPVAQRRYVFQLAPDAGHDADLLATELARSGPDQLMLVTLDDDGGYGDDGARELPDALDAAGITVVRHERLPAGADESVAAGLAARLADWRPEPPIPGFPAPAPVTGPPAVVLWTPPEPAYRIAAGLRDAGWDGDLWLDAAAAGSVFLPTGAGVADALAGARLVFTETLVVDQTLAVTPATVARQAWWRSYLARYGDYDAYASFAADAVEVLVTAVNRMDTIDRDQLRDTIEATTMDGLTGPIRFTPETHSGLQPLALTVLVAAGDRWRLQG